MRYKLIQEYPNSPKVGHIIEECEEPGLKNYYTSVKEDDDCSRVGMLHISEIVRCPNIWEEVVEKDYEILSIYNKISDRILTDSNVQTWIIKPFTRRNWEIHSIRRLSDGEIFTIGDKLKGYNNTGIKEIYIYPYGLRIITDANGDGCVTDKLSWKLENCIKLKQPLFTTEDGVDIYEKNHPNVYYVSLVHYSMIGIDLSNTLYNPDLKNFKYFSTREAAEEYILMNRPTYSLNDVIASIPKNTSHYSCITNLIENLKNM